MAVGDVVNGYSGINTILTYQPAAGVEVMVTMAHDGNGALYLTDGVNNGRGLLVVDPATSILQAANLKMFITNTRYLALGAVAGVRTWFTGIQTK